MFCDRPVPFITHVQFDFLFILSIVLSWEHSSHPATVVVSVLGMSEWIEIIANIDFSFVDYYTNAIDCSCSQNVSLIAGQRQLNISAGISILSLYSHGRAIQQISFYYAPL